MPGTLRTRRCHPPACGGPGPGKRGCPFRGGPPELSWPLKRTWGSSWLREMVGLVPTAFFLTVLLQQDGGGWEGERMPWG